MQSAKDDRRAKPRCAYCTHRDMERFKLLNIQALGNTYEAVYCNIFCRYMNSAEAGEAVQCIAYAPELEEEAYGK